MKASHMYGIAVEEDQINHPAHYTSGGIETIDYIQSKMTVEQFHGYCLGNAMKYISRSGKKDNFRQDIAKAAWYLNRILTVG